MKIKIPFLTIYLVLFLTPLASYAQWGGGDCGQENTLGTIIECSNCTIIDGDAAGSLGSDQTLDVEAISCGPISITIRYSFDWNPGSENNWIHGISFYASDFWSSQEVTTPPDWIFMPNGVVGCCSQSQYGPGYYYDGSNETNCDPSGTNSCDDLGPYPTTPNDGDPGNSWGVLCTDDCPVFDFRLTFCPSSATGSMVVEDITFATSADGESGGYNFDRNCDVNNTFSINISNLCTVDASFDDIPDNYCNASGVPLNNPSATYDGGHTTSEEWEGGVVQTPGQANVTFEYCDNIGNTSITHTVGHDKC